MPISVKFIIKYLVCQLSFQILSDFPDINGTANAQHLNKDLYIVDSISRTTYLKGQFLGKVYDICNDNYIPPDHMQILFVHN